MKGIFLIIIYLWGKVKTSHKTKSVGQLIDTKTIYKKNYVYSDKILWVNTSTPRFAVRSFSFIISSQWQIYLDFQFSLIKLLKPDLVNKIFVRLDESEEYKLFEKDIWKDNFNAIKFDNKNISFFKSVKESKLVVCTYNATTFHETFMMDIPTILLGSNLF